MIIRFHVDYLTNPQRITIQQTMHVEISIMFCIITNRIGTNNTSRSFSLCFFPFLPHTIELSYPNNNLDNQTSITIVRCCCQSFSHSVVYNVVIWQKEQQVRCPSYRTNESFLFFSLYFSSRLNCSDLDLHPLVRSFDKKEKLTDDRDQISFDSRASNTHTHVVSLSHEWIHACVSDRFHRLDRRKMSCDPTWAVSSFALM